MSFCKRKCLKCGSYDLGASPAESEWEPDTEFYCNACAHIWIDRGAAKDGMAGDHAEGVVADPAGPTAGSVRPGP